MQIQNQRNWYVVKNLLSYRKRFCRIRDKVSNQLITDQIYVNFLESVVQNISFGFSEISNSATKKIFPVLILVYFVNRLFTCLGRIIENEGMLEFYIDFLEGIIYVITFCYLVMFDLIKFDDLTPEKLTWILSSYSTIAPFSYYFYLIR